MKEEKESRLTKELNKNYIRGMVDDDRDRIRENVIKHSDMSLKEMEKEEKKRILLITETCKRDRNREIYDDYLRGFNVSALSMKYCLSNARINAILKAERNNNDKFTNSGLLNELVERTDISTALKIQTQLRRSGIFTLADLLQYRGKIDMIPGIGRAYYEVLTDMRETLFVEREEPDD